ncbi:hypothetical protein, partial [Catellatospora chokoriensis]
PALVERWPEAYPGLTPDALSEIARSLGVASVDVKVGGKVLKGYRRTDIGKILAARTGPDGR